jgi:hypothetical protein
MIKKKAKGKTATKKAEKEEEGAKKIAKAVMNQAMSGTGTDEVLVRDGRDLRRRRAEGTVDEESLAATLLRRLDIFREADHAERRGRTASRCFSGEADCEASGRR